MFNLYQKSAVVTSSFSQLCFIQCFEPIRLHIRIFLSCIYLPELQIPGLVNVDFADVRAIMANAGSSLMGIGTATGKLTKLFLIVVGTKPFLFVGFLLIYDVT